MSSRTITPSRWRWLHTKWARICLGALVLGAVAAVVWAIWFSHLLAATKVVVTGETTVTDDQVRAAADIRMGDPLIRIDTVAIESRVSAMERVARVSVSRSLPHTIRIEITERTSIAWIRTSDGIRGVDRSGVNFRGFDKEPDSLVEIRSLPNNPEPRQNALVAAASVIDDIRTQDAGLGQQVQSVSATSRDAIELDLTEGRTVVWGSADASEAKIAVLKSLLDIKAAHYDVSAPEQPTTRK